MGKLVKGRKLKPLRQKQCDLTCDLNSIVWSSILSWLFNVEGTYVYLNTFFKKRTATQ